MEKEQTIYSFSKLEKFNQCQYSYYLTYIKKLRSPDDGNIYGVLGSEVHSILEHLQTQKITKETALERFNEKVDEVLLFGMEFATPKSGEKYVQDVRHYLENYERFDVEDFEIEEHFITDIDGIKVQGYIDLYYKDENGLIHVVDYKTSTKFSKKDMPKKTRQLILYGYALEQLKKGKVKEISFDLLKYCSKPWRKTVTLKERCELSELEYYPRALVTREYNQESVEEMKSYIKGIVQDIESKDPDNEFDWKPTTDFRTNYFCSHLCEHYQTKNCRHHFR